MLMREKTEADLGAPEHHVHTSPRSAVSARRDSARRTRPAPNPRAPGLLAGYTGLKSREAKIPAPVRPRLSEALQQLVQCYDAWGKKEQADEWWAKLPKDAAAPNRPGGQ